MARPSPSEHASELDLGTEMMGNDGYLYRVCRRAKAKYWRNLGYKVDKKALTKGKYKIVISEMVNKPKIKYDEVCINVDEDFLENLKNKPKIKVENNRKTYLFGPKEKEYTLVCNIYIRGMFLIMEKIMRPQFLSMNANPIWKRLYPLNKKFEESINNYNNVKLIRKIISDKLLFVGEASCNEFSLAVCIGKNSLLIVDDYRM